MRSLAAASRVAVAKNVRSKSGLRLRRHSRKSGRLPWYWPVLTAQGTLLSIWPDIMLNSLCKRLARRTSLNLDAASSCFTQGSPGKVGKRRLDFFGATGVTVRIPTLLTSNRQRKAFFQPLQSKLVGNQRLGVTLTLYQFPIGSGGIILTPLTLPLPPVGGERVAEGRVSLDKKTGRGKFPGLSLINFQCFYQADFVSSALDLTDSRCRHQLELIERRTVRSGNSCLIIAAHLANRSADIRPRARDQVCS